MTKVWIAETDITKLSVDVIVCAANSGLVLGCGVAGAIWRRGGPEIQEECNRLGKFAPGDVAVTTAGKLAAKKVFHAISMGYRHPNVTQLLDQVTTRCLAKASVLKFESIVFPAIAAGRMKVAPEISCSSMGQSIANFDFTKSSLRSVGFALLDKDVFEVFQKHLPLNISSNKNLEWSLDHPPVVEMPWRS